MSEKHMSRQPSRGLVATRLGFSGDGVVIDARNEGGRQSRNRMMTAAVTYSTLALSTGVGWLLR